MSDDAESRMLGYARDPDSLADDISAEIHMHCGDDGQDDAHNDWIGELVGRLMILLGVDR